MRQIERHTRQVGLAGLAQVVVIHELVLLVDLLLIGRDDLPIGSLW